MEIGERQRKLSLWAEQDKEFRFYDLYGLLYNQDWLKAAHASVSKNAGSATAGTEKIALHIDNDERQAMRWALIGNGEATMVGMDVSSP
jgi:hypothetical protein